MANIKSQKKRIRQDKKRNIRNKSIKTQLKGVLKSVENEKVENKEIAMKTQYAWDQQFNSQINVVLGDEWYAGNLSYHLKSRPIWEGAVEREKLDQLKDYMCLDSICVGSR